MNIHSQATNNKPIARGAFLPLRDVSHFVKRIAEVEARLPIPKVSAAGVAYTDKRIALVGSATYLELRGWDERGGCHLWATSLGGPESAATSGNGVGSLPFAVKKSDSCTGAPCSSCSFTYYEIDGEPTSTINGCKYNETGADKKCNHSISTASAAPR